MQLQVIRNSFGPLATEGKLYIGDAYECDTLEPTYREVDGQPVSSWKIPNKTAIPKGTYRVTVDFSPKFGQMMPLLVGIEDFEAVRIHWGNSDVDTDGCILLGQGVAGYDFINASRAAFAQFFPKLEAALNAGEEVTITVG